MAHIPAGTYLSGHEPSPVWLPAYHIDVYPVTNNDYDRFISATGHPTPAHWIDGHCPDNIRDHPVVFVTWHDADAYAAWTGKRLPTSQQWEKAARGADGQTYPWGSTSSPAKCNVRESGSRTTTPVTRYHSGASAYGVYDLCGNAWEWCDTTSEPDRRELKGSAFTSSFSRAAPSFFNDANTDMRDDDTGFRCATATTVVLHPART